VRRRLGARKASFASSDETKDITGMMIGGVTAFGLPTTLPLWIDGAVLDRPRIILGGGSRDCKLLVAPSALLSVPGAEVVDDLARPTADPG
jgi:prolyl-tRNA editing enzyme YbaK/EbsC (Cys-tRNA(Pro) deacylase)